MADDEPATRIHQRRLGPSETAPITNEARRGDDEDRRQAFARVSAETAVLFGVLAVLVIFFSITSQYFLNSANLINILQNSARIGIVACAATLLLISGQFDLSVGSAAAFVAMVTAIAAATSVDHPITPGLPMWVALLAGWLRPSSSGC